MNKEPRALLLKGRGKTTIMSFFLKNENVLYIALKTLFGTKYGLRKLDGVTMCVILDSSTKEQRKEVATWLKAEAAKLTKFGKDYSKRFTVRLFR